MRTLDEAVALNILVNLNYLHACRRQDALIAPQQGIGQVRRKRKYKLPVQRRMWVRPWNRAQRRLLYGHWDNLLPQLRQEDPEAWFNYMRMRPEMFDEIVQRVGPRIQGHTTNCRQPLPSGLKLAITIRHLAAGDGYASLAYQFRVSRHTITAFLPKVCQAITDVFVDEVMECPTDSADWLEIAQQFQTRWNLPHALGALDGKHIQIRKPAQSGSLYRNYKKFFSIVLLGLVDADYKFIWADVGGLGHQSDAQLYNDSDLQECLEDGTLDIPAPSPLPNDNQDTPYFFVGDDAFALRTTMMKPYSQRGLSDSHLIYNYRISRARRVVENAFGILAQRWRFLLQVCQQEPDNVRKMVMTAVCLHNLMRIRYPHAQNAALDQEDDDHNVVPGEWRQDANMRDMRQAVGRQHDTIAAKDMREMLKAYFNSPAGSVPWQNRHI